MREGVETKGKKKNSDADSRISQEDLRAGKMGRAIGASPEKKGEKKEKKKLALRRGGFTSSGQGAPKQEMVALKSYALIKVRRGIEE